MKISILTSIFIALLFYPFAPKAQWVQVLDQVTPVQIAISPEYHLDQTVYIVDDGARLLISETGGSNWIALYEATDPQNPAQAILHIEISPNFKNDNAIIMVHKDGKMKISPNRGQSWLTSITPEGTSGVVFSANFAEDFSLYAISGAIGPVNFYTSSTAGASWQLISEIFFGGGYYSRLWNSIDTGATNHFAIQYENNSVYMTANKGTDWTLAYSGQSPVNDFAFSPDFSNDSTVFLAEDSVIYKNTNSGMDTSWVNTGHFPGGAGIRLAISPMFNEDRALFTAVEQAGIFRSTDGGASWYDISDGLDSMLPISIAISQTQVYTLFAGTKAEDGGSPGKLWRYQSSTSIGDNGLADKVRLKNFPNPFPAKTQILFEMPENGHATLSIIDITGQQLAVLIDHHLVKGKHSIDFDNSSYRLNAGIYFLRLQSNLKSTTAKMIIQ
jgi:photosystem II stability/assembly factor-like uncharacterized protein